MSFRGLRVFDFASFLYLQRVCCLQLSWAVAALSLNAAHVFSNWCRCFLNLFKMFYKHGISSLKEYGWVSSLPNRHQVKASPVFNAATLTAYEAQLLEEMGHQLDMGVANPLLWEEICLISDFNLRAICGSVRGAMGLFGGGGEVSLAGPIQPHQRGEGPPRHQGGPQGALWVVCCLHATEEGRSSSGLPTTPFPSSPTGLIHWLYLK